MKLFKKTAALLFCLALIVGVMAVSASAAEDDYAELMARNGSGVILVERNSNFRVWLTPSPTGQAEDVTSRDSDTTFEIDADDAVKFDIKLAYVGTTYKEGETNARNINGFQFDFDPASTSGTTGNKGAKITEVMIFRTEAEYTAYNDSESVASKGHNIYSASAATAKRFAYTAQGDGDNDIVMPDADGRVIGTMTLDFSEATPDTKIFPVITNLQVKVRDVESPQRPIAQIFDSTTGAIVAPGTGTSPTSPAVATDPTPGATSTPDSTATNADDVVVQSDTAVIVNPVFKVTLYEYEADTTTGILKKKAASYLYYDFTNGSFVRSGGSNTTQTDYTHTKDSKTYATILTNTAHPGYTLQGWMVTSVDDSNGSTTWAAYDETSITAAADKWGNQSGSYPATTDRDDGTGQGHKYITMTDVCRWTTHPWFTSKVDNGNSDVNFITVKDASGVTGCTKFPAHQVGDITLTAVYTRNVYIAKFDAGAPKAEFVGKATSDLTQQAVTSGNSKQNAQYTKNYTIEDLYSAQKAAETTDNPYRGYEDFLTLNDPADGQPTGPQNLKRTAYKFMGWEVTINKGQTNCVTETDESGYAWKAPVKNSVEDGVGTDKVENPHMLLTTASCKHYGDVTFKAFWEEDIYFATLNYKYAPTPTGTGTQYSLVLVGVPTDSSKDLGDLDNNYDNKYTYTCNSLNANDTSATFNMFTVPAFVYKSGSNQGKPATSTDSNAQVCAQRAAYVSAATGANNDNSDFDDNSTKFPTTSGNEDKYVIFAYIAPSTTKITDIEINEYTDTCGNDALAYGGDIDGSNAIDVSDFGNVDSLFLKNYTNVLSVTDLYGVKARLQADVYVPNPADADAQFGSIADIKTIYNRMGYKLTI